ncbi:MAG: DNA polymerase III subunit delta', partial [Clostridia bacterium]|nr:DNA polymerase III subunit delta' [Clostridia bacterium]
MQMPLIGNKRICSMVNSMVKNRRIPHAILIEGEEGLGKSTLSRYIAKAALCDNENPPCDECKTCHLIDVGSHPDFQVVEPDGAQIKVAQIRELRVEAFLSPMSAGGRVFVISAAHTMNDSAQNAFLKVLEEPPANVTFILLAKSASLMLETIRSR